MAKERVHVGTLSTMRDIYDNQYNCVCCPLCLSRLKQLPGVIGRRLWIRQR